MYEILKKAPITGIYMNEDPAHWKHFFRFYLDFLNSESGPRGQCAKKIRKQLQLNKQEVDIVLFPYGMNHKTHIRCIYAKFKHFSPCQQYHFYQLTLYGLVKYEQNLSRLQQSDHPMYQSIANGMIKKYGELYPIEKQIQKLRQNYSEKINKLKKDKIQYEKKLKSNQAYNNWNNMNKVMNKWFNEWADADSGMGKSSCNRGELFQTKVLHNVIPQIMHRQRKGVLSHIEDQLLFTPQSINNMVIQSTLPPTKKNRCDRLHIFINMKWVPRSIGEIDIAIVEWRQKQQLYEALILIQCKARLFDVREASYQVFAQYLKSGNKVELSGKYGSVFVSSKVASYIVTTLPDFDFLMPIQSSLKGTLDRITKDKPVEEINQQFIKEQLFQECSKKFRSEMSPFEWFINNDSNNIIVLSGRTQFSNDF